MNNIQPTYKNRVRYTLRNVVFGTSRISEPIGWNDDEKEFKRSTEVHGVFINLSNNLKFYKGDENRKGGFDFIKGVFDQQGINADIILIKDEQNPQTDLWEEAYRGFLDLSTMIIENNQISVKFNESGLYAALKARQSEKLELGRLDTMDGDILQPLVLQKVALNGRNIFLVSQLEINLNFENPITIEHNSGQVFQARALPQTVLASSDDSVQFMTDQFVNENTTSYDSGSTGHQFYAIADKDKTLEVTFDIDYSWISNGSNTVKLDLITYENGINYDFKSFQTLVTVSTVNGQIQFNQKLTINLLAGESLTLASHSQSLTNVKYTWAKLDTLIEEDSFFDASQADFILPFEALERLIHITTNEESALVSNFLGRTDLGHSIDGEGSLSGITNGLLVRGFTDKQIQTSYRDFNDSFEGVWNTGYGIEKVGFKEFVRFEDKKYFYQKVVTVKLPNQVKKIKRTVATDYFFSGINLGYEKGAGDNEEVMGLQEYNANNTYTDIIKRVEKVYKKLSKYVGGAFTMEFARRKSILTDPTEDTRFDFYIFIMDLKRGATDIFQQRLWQDDFAKEPTGVFSPETAQNLRFTPFNILIRRHGWWIRAGLQKYKDSFVRFSSSNGNTDLSTQLIGGTEQAENGKILVSELESPFLLPEIIEFEHEANTEILQQVQGKTLVDGENIMNYYGQIEFINENNEKEAGYLLELKPNKEGKWKLIKANKPVARFTTVNTTTDNITTPLNLVGNPSRFTIDLTWNESTSISGISNYRVYLDGVIVGNPINNNFTIEGLTKGTEYSIYVEAVNNNALVSQKSNTILITTLELNTFIGGVSSTINTPTLLALKLSKYPSFTTFDVSDIKEFEIDGSDIRCVIDVDYARNAFSMSALITNYDDIEGRCKHLGLQAFNQSLNLDRLYFPGVLKIDVPVLPAFSFEFNAISKMYFPECVDWGDLVTQEGMFRSNYVGDSDVYVHPSMLTINSGGLEGDLDFAETTLGHVIIPVTNPIPINDL